MKTLSELMEEEEERNREAHQRELDKYDSPEEVALREARRRDEFERGIRLGWWDADGNPIHDENDNDETDEDETDDDQ